MLPSAEILHANNDDFLIAEVEKLRHRVFIAEMGWLPPVHKFDDYDRRGEVLLMRPAPNAPWMATAALDYRREHPILLEEDIDLSPYRTQGLCGSVRRLAMMREFRDFSHSLTLFRFILQRAKDNHLRFIFATSASKERTSLYMHMGFRVVHKGITYKLMPGHVWSALVLDLADNQTLAYRYA